MTARDPQGEREFAEFTGWMEAQGHDPGDDSVVYGSGDMIDAFTSGMQAQRDLDAASRNWTEVMAELDRERAWRLRLAGECDEARSDCSRLRAVILDGGQPDAVVRRRCLAILGAAGTLPTGTPLDVQRAARPWPGHWHIEGPAHDSMLHTHEHEGRPSSTEPHSHPHGGPGQGWTHVHPHRHVYDLPALEADGE